jgi:NAD-specific glutamate dehydrogenase
MLKNGGWKNHYTDIYLNEHTGLVVRVGGEGLGLLGGNGGVSLDEGGHHASGGLDTQAEGSDIEQQKILDGLRLVTSEDGSLDSGTVRNSLIRVDGLVELLAVEEVLQQLLDLGDASRASNQDDVVNLGLVHLGVAKRLLDRLEGGPEEISAQLLKTRPGDGRVEVNALVQGVNLDRGLSGGGKGALCTLASGAETTQSPLVGGEVLLVLALELLHEVVDHAVVEVLTAQVSVAGGRLDLEDAVLDGEDGDIKSATTEIEDEHVPLALTLLVEAVGDGSSCGLVDDTEHVEAGDGARVLGGLSLTVVEVGGHGDDGIANSLAEVCLSGLLHLDEHHRAHFLREKGLQLSLVFHLQFGLAILADDIEWPVLHVSLHCGVFKLAPNQSLGI